MVVKNNLLSEGGTIISTSTCGRVVDKIKSKRNDQYAKNTVSETVKNNLLS